VVPASAGLHVLAADTGGSLAQGLLCVRQHLAIDREVAGEWTIVVDGSAARWKARPADPGSLAHLPRLVAYAFAHLWPALRAATQAAAAPTAAAGGVLLVPTALAVPNGAPCVAPAAAAGEVLRFRSASSSAEAVFIAAAALPMADVLERPGSVLVELPRGTGRPHAGRRVVEGH